MFDDSYNKVFQNYRNRYQKRKSFKDQIDLYMNESPKSVFPQRREGISNYNPFPTTSLRSKSRLGGNFKVRGESGGKCFDDVLDNYFLSLPKTKDFKDDLIKDKNWTRSQKRLQDAINEINEDFSFNSIGRKADRYDSSRYDINERSKLTSLGRSPEKRLYGKNSILRTPITSMRQHNKTNRFEPKINNKQEMFREELRKVIKSLEKMNSIEFEELPLNYRNDLNKLAQMILFKQK